MDKLFHGSRKDGGAQTQESNFTPDKDTRVTLVREAGSC